MGKQRFIIAGGGTGGHIFPAIAIANALKSAQPAAEILFVGATGKMEMEKVPQAGFKIEGITIAGFNRSSLLKNVKLPFKLLVSFFQVRNIINGFRPDAVIGVGGYSSFPVLKYAQAKRIPTFIHESNSFAGKSNIMLGKRAKKVFTATDGMQKFFPPSHTVVTGNPVRKEIAKQKVSREEALNFFGLDPAGITVLSIGGSLGAKTINETIDVNVSKFYENGLQLIWQTGKPYKETAENRTRGMKGIYVSDFIRNMETAYAAADIVISRSGAMAIAELCIVKKPVVFVPYPFAAEDHQTANALSLVAKDAAIIVKDSDAKNNLIPEVLRLSKDRQRQELLSVNISKLAISDADTRIANEILMSLKND